MLERSIRLGTISASVISGLSEEEAQLNSSGIPINIFRQGEGRYVIAVAKCGGTEEPPAFGLLDAAFALGHKFVFPI